MAVWFFNSSICSSCSVARYVKVWWSASALASFWDWMTFWPTMMIGSNTR